MTKRRKRAPYQRKTISVGGKTQSAPFHFDQRSELAMAYAQHLLYGVGRLEVPTSGILRRALEVYADHLGATANDPEGAELADMKLRAEFNRTKEACAGNLTGPLFERTDPDEEKERQQHMLSFISDLPHAKAPPSFGAVLRIAAADRDTRIKEAIRALLDRVEVTEQQRQRAEAYRRACAARRGEVEPTATA